MTTLGAASGNSVAPGTLGFVVVFGMAIVLFFLFRSMSRHLRKVNAAARRDQAADSSAADSSAAENGAAENGAAENGAAENGGAGAVSSSDRR